MGAGYSLNVASAEAAPEPPSGADRQEPALPAAIDPPAGVGVPEPLQEIAGDGVEQIALRGRQIAAPAPGKAVPPFFSSSSCFFFSISS